MGEYCILLGKTLYTKGKDDCLGQTWYESILEGPAMGSSPKQSPVKAELSFCNRGTQSCHIFHISFEDSFRLNSSKSSEFSHIVFKESFKRLPIVTGNLLQGKTSPFGIIHIPSLPMTQGAPKSFGSPSLKLI